MKFAKRLRESLHPEWAEAYVDYKLLKKVLNQLFGPHIVTAFCEQLEVQIRKVAAFMQAQQDALASDVPNLSQILEDSSFKNIDLAVCGLQRPGAEYSSRHCQALIDSIQKFHDYAALNQEALRKIVKKFDKRFHLEFSKELNTCPPSMPYTAKDIQAKLLIPAYRCLRCMRALSGSTIERPVQQLHFWAGELSTGCDLLRLRFDPSKPEGICETVLRLQLLFSEVREPDDPSLLVKNTFIGLSEATSGLGRRSQSAPPSFRNGSEVEDLPGTPLSEQQQEYYSSPTSSMGDDSHDYQDLSGGTSWGSVPMPIMDYMMRMRHPLQASPPARDNTSFAASRKALQEQEFPLRGQRREFSSPVELDYASWSSAAAAGELNSPVEPNYAAWSPAAAAAAGADWGDRQRFIDPAKLRGVAGQARKTSDTPSTSSSSRCAWSTASSSHTSSVSTVATKCGSGSGSSSAVSGGSSSGGNEAATPAWRTSTGQQRQQTKARRPGKQVSPTAACALPPAVAAVGRESGTRPGLQPPLPFPAGAKASRWWTQQPATCPISGFPINLLPYPPFKLRINAGSAHQYALIDPLYFTLEILSTWNFQAGGRTLTAQDISALDLHIRRCKLGPWRLGEAFEHFRAGSGEGHGELEDLRAKAMAKLELIQKIQHNRRRHLDLD
eukprot:TRINITY_DN41195_c0_g1_i1.p1 TRINITY_DN41195_c0_g1~~TRINITY_DN41195_c0_g1_i1.p1  ORF type:complete len:668 (-),score=125.50 TRINITY_DN41195_c0_g1_i1:51-2054(-)